MTKQHHSKRLKTSGFFDQDSISQCTFTNYVSKLDQDRKPTTLKKLKKIHEEYINEMRKAKSNTSEHSRKSIFGHILKANMGFTDNELSNILMESMNSRNTTEPKATITYNINNVGIVGDAYAPMTVNNIASNEKKRDFESVPDDFSNFPEEENDDNYLEEDSDHIPSDLTIDYHPGRKSFYHFEEYISNGDENIVLQNNDKRAVDDKRDESQKNDFSTENIHSKSSDKIIPTDIWVTTDKTDLVEACYNFKKNTLKLHNLAEQLSDLRFLALHDIFLFDHKQQCSISKDWSVDLHKQAMSTFKINEPPKPLNSTGWCMDFGLTYGDDWMTQLSKAATYLVEAISMKNMVDIHTVQAVMQLLPLFANGPPNFSIEDSYVHNYIAPILQPIFAGEPLLHIQWANSYLDKKGNKIKKEIKKDKINMKMTGQAGEKQKKPDFVANVKAMNSWISVTVGEFKPPGFSSCFESDLVKIGKEMRTMLNALILLGVSDPSVGGILIQGHHISTYKFDIIAPKVYRMITLSKLTVFENLDQIAILPAIVSRLMQVKQIAIDTAKKVESLSNSRKLNMNAAPISPQQLWISENGYFLKKRKAPRNEDENE